MNRPIHFEMHSSNPAVTNAFFERVFGWKISAWAGPVEYWVVATGSSNPGIDGGIMASRDGQQRTVNTIEVQSVDAMAAQITAAGGQICVPKMAIPGVGWLTYALDPTGVLFGFMHTDPNAK